MDGKAQAITDNIPDTAHKRYHTHTQTHTQQYMHIHSRHWQCEIILSFFHSGEGDTF